MPTRRTKGESYWPMRIMISASVAAFAPFDRRATTSIFEELAQNPRCYGRDRIHLEPRPRHCPAKRVSEAEDAFALSAGEDIAKNGDLTDRRIQRIDGDDRAVDVDGAIHLANEALRSGAQFRALDQRVADADEARIAGK